MTTHSTSTPLSVLLVFLLIPVFLQAQSIDRSVVATAGQSDSNQEFMLDWTLGEIAVETIYHPEITLTEGFQQSYLQVNELTPQSDSDWEITVAPNPVRRELNVYFKDLPGQFILLELFDAGGRALDQLKVDTAIEVVNIDMTAYPQGMYFLRVMDEVNGTLMQSYKISKLD